MPRRFKTLGEKRNATIGLASDTADAVLIWDDDDLYLPSHLSAAAVALQQAPWSRPSVVLYEHPKSLSQHATNGLYQGGWSFRLENLPGATGRGLPGGAAYTATSINEDQVLAHDLQRRGVCSADPIALGQTPTYIYRHDSSDSYHASYMQDCGTAWKILASEKKWQWTEPPLSRERLEELARAAGQEAWICWPRDYRAIPIEGLA